MEMSAISREGKRTSGEANLCQNKAFVLRQLPYT